MIKYCFYAAVAYMLFVVYGSLVPLHYHSVPWDVAQDRFSNIPYLNLGMASRADWIANIILYIPLAFLWSLVLGQGRHVVLRFLGQLLVLVGCLLVAITVEFCQIFFPPRTVSLNDLIAEFLGTGLGLLAAQLWAQRFLNLASNLSLAKLLSVKTVIKLYLLGYCVLSFFPYDFVASFAELEIKLLNGGDHWLMSVDACRAEGVRCGIKFLVEIVVLVPVGGLFYLLPQASHKLALALIVGFFLGIFSELVQLFLISGLAQGMSILTRMLGIGLGVIIVQRLYQQPFSYWQRWLKPLIVMAVLPYFVFVFISNGGLTDEWLSSDVASAKLAETRFLPFYYFYYTSETAALVSLMGNIGLYLPIGVACCLWQWAGSNRRTTSWLLIGLGATVLAVLVEAEKLFLINKHADPTDIWIAFIAAGGGYGLVNKARRWLMPNSVRL